MISVFTKQMLFIAVSVVALGSFGVGGTYLFARRIENSYQEARKIYETRAAIQAQREEVRQFNAISSQYTQEFAQLDGVLLNVDVPTQFFRFLQNVAKETYVDISITPSSYEPSREGSWASVNLQVNLKGSYSDSLSFMEKLENAAYLINIQSINITKTGGDDQDLQTNEDVAMNLGLKVYAR